MRRDPRKIAAATAAVVEYLASEKRSAQRIEPPPAAEASRQENAGSSWAVHGRSELMQLRSLMQLRAFRRI